MATSFLLSGAVGSRVSLRRWGPVCLKPRSAGLQWQCRDLGQLRMPGARVADQSAVLWVQLALGAACNPVLVKCKCQGLLLAPAGRCRGLWRSRRQGAAGRRWRCGCRPVRVGYCAAGERTLQFMAL